jgi:hypothetical protein
MKNKFNIKIIEYYSHYNVDIKLNNPNRIDIYYGKKNSKDITREINESFYGIRIKRGI